MACHWGQGLGRAEADAGNSPRNGGGRSFRRNVGVTADFEVASIYTRYAAYPRDSVNATSTMRFLFGEASSVSSRVMEDESAYAKYRYIFR